MSEGRSSNNDPSMDDILASIRKIISDDEARTQVGDPAVRPEPAGAEPEPTVPATAAAKRDDVLLLTDLIEEPPHKASEVQTTSIPLPLNDSVSAPTMSQQSNDSSEPLIGSSVAGATSSAFDRLNQAVQESVPPPAAAEPGPALGAGGKTIEEMVKDMLRPMLKEWLDRNLPPIVERYVEREIVRLTRR
jgi:cell pole-organizing protein PopZ